MRVLLRTVLKVSSRKTIQFSHMGVLNYWSRDLPGKFQTNQLQYLRNYPELLLQKNWKKFVVTWVKRKNMRHNLKKTELRLYIRFMHFWRSFEHGYHACPYGSWASKINQKVGPLRGPFGSTIISKKCSWKFRAWTVNTLP